MSNNANYYEPRENVRGYEPPAPAGVHGDGFGPNDWPEEVRPRSATSHHANVAHRKGEVKQSRDRAQYVRQQKGHSFILEVLVLGIFTLWIRPIYLAASPNHYFHL
jgi:hypothetical protein